ncbi:hypothetical protein HFP51_05325 [Parasphingopyxis sp. CP4]|uniref:hypothetical protein n=1 Tax=Parasphingopyxis sp. CP4 TaxID=2724527 RepID=UPI0015A0336B|nr:hypothetical protein [Parasphingopyxis sp. CP4]QLC21647.1 hypothetical protein HFP51_05325 [Parasphingopyxis sp. CP4]
MVRDTNIVIAAILVANSPAAYAKTDAGSRIVTAADVTVSDGTTYRASTEYQAPDRAEYLQQYPDMTMRFAIDGETVSVWRDGEALTRFPAGIGIWALGHQFHAQLTSFAEINGGIIAVAAYDGEGDCPCTEYRGRLSAEGMGIEGYGLVVSNQSGRAQRFFVHRQDQAPVTTTFDDWRSEADRELPYRVVIDDGEDVYDFRFSSIEFG